MDELTEEQKEQLKKLNEAVEGKIKELEELGIKPYIVGYHAEMDRVGIWKGDISAIEEAGFSKIAGQQF